MLSAQAANKGKTRHLSVAWQRQCFIQVCIHSIYFAGSCSLDTSVQFNLVEFSIGLQFIVLKLAKAPLSVSL